MGTDRHTNWEGGLWFLCSAVRLVAVVAGFMHADASRVPGLAGHGRHPVKDWWRCLCLRDTIAQLSARMWQARCLIVIFTGNTAAIATKTTLFQRRHRFHLMGEIQNTSSGTR